MERIKGGFQKIKEGEKGLRKEIKEKTVSYIVAAFGLVAGLAWNEAIKSLIESFFPISKNNLLAKFIYAFLMTLVVVIITVYLMRLIRQEEQK